METFETLEKIRVNYDFWNEKERPYYEALSKAIRVLNAQEDKAHYAKIVRCRECKWYGIYYAKKDGTPDKRYSPSVCLRGKYAKRRDPDWYCADGEREVQE